MGKIIKQPIRLKGEGTGIKYIDEYFGAVSTEQKNISIAVMEGHEGWEEPWQVAKFDEYVYVISGCLFIKTKNEDIILKEKQAAHIKMGEKVQFSTPFQHGANYIAICVPAFKPSLVKRSK